MINVTSDNDLLLDYFCHQLELFSNICYGRQQHAIKQLSMGLNVNLLLSIVSNEKIPYRLRAASCKLITYLFVDSEVKMDELKCTCEPMENGENENLDNGEKEKNEGMEKLVSYVEIYLKEVAKHGFITQNSVI